MTYIERYNQAKECASFINGKCWETGSLCKIANYTDIPCTYFETHVAPIFDKPVEKRCHHCKVSFEPETARTVVCSKCKTKQATERKRKQRS